jgi:hypothetical protein
VPEGTPGFAIHRPHRGAYEGITAETSRRSRREEASSSAGYARWPGKDDANWGARTGHVRYRWLVRPRPIIVLGSERSGTSAVAEMVHGWGAYAGETVDLPVPDRRNARGRWEYQPLWDLLAQIGEFDRGRSWWDESFPDIVAGQLADERLVVAAREMVGRMEAPGRPWVWKDPTLCHFLPFWMRIWRDPVFVITVRNPADVAASWREFTRHEGVDTHVEVNLLRWQHTMVTVLHETDTRPDRLFVSYEALMTDPNDQVARIAAHLDEAVGEGVPDRVDAMRAVCDPSLWHNRNHDADAEQPVLSEAQTRLYAQLLAMTTQPSTPQHGDFPLPPDWRRRVIEEGAKGRSGAPTHDANRTDTSVPQNSPHQPRASRS